MTIRSPVTPGSIAGYADTSVRAATVWDNPEETASTQERRERVAALVWEQSWRLGLDTTYRYLAVRIEHDAQVAAAGLGDGNDRGGRAREALARLQEVAAAAASSSEAPLLDSADDRVARHVHDRALGGWQALCRRVWDEGHHHGLLHGGLHAARDILAGWRAVTSQQSRDARLGEGTVTEWVHRQLAATNKEYAHELSQGGPSRPTTVARTSFAEAPTTSAPAPAATAAGHPPTTSRRAPDRRARA